MTRRKAVLYLLATALLWSTGGLFIKWIDLHPLALAGLRSAISALFLLAATGRLSPRRLRLLRQPPFRLSPLSLAAGLSYAGVVILFVLATKLTTAANAIVLQYTAPIFVALFSYGFLGERVSGADWLTIGAVLGGLLLFFVGRLSPAGLWGNLIAIGAGMCFAWLALLLRRQKDASPVESIILGNLLAALICLPFILRARPSPADWLGVLYLGVVQLGAAYLLYSQAVPYVRAVELILIPVIEPLLNPVWVFLALGERPGLWGALGGVVVVGAVTFQGLRAARSARRVTAGG